LLPITLVVLGRIKDRLKKPVKRQTIVLLEPVSMAEECERKTYQTAGNVGCLVQTKTLPRLVEFMMDHWINNTVVGVVVTSK